MNRENRISHFVDRVTSFGLGEKEQALFSISTLSIAIAIVLAFPDEKMNEYLKLKKPINSDEEELLLIDYLASNYISGPKAEILKLVFTLGYFQAKRKSEGSLKSVASELHISWSECIKLYKSAVTEVYSKKRKEYFERD